MGMRQCSYSFWAGVVESVLWALGASWAGPSTCKSLFWLLSGALTGSRWLCGLSALAEGGLTGSEGVGLDEGGTLGVSLRSTRGPTSGWVLALSELDWAAGLFLGEDLAGAALVGLEALVVSVVLSLAGLLCAVLKLSATELVAAEGSRFTTVEVASAAAGLFGWEEQDKQRRRGRSGEGRKHRAEKVRERKKASRGVEGECRSGHKQGRVSAVLPGERKIYLLYLNAI